MSESPPVEKSCVYPYYTGYIIGYNSLGILFVCFALILCGSCGLTFFSLDNQTVYTFWSWYSGILFQNIQEYNGKAAKLQILLVFINPIFFNNGLEEQRNYVNVCTILHCRRTKPMHCMFRQAKIRLRTVPANREGCCMCKFWNTLEYFGIFWYILEYCRIFLLEKILEQYCMWISQFIFICSMFCSNSFLISF